MKVIMLDIDGVLFTYNNYIFSPAACKNLNSLLQQMPDVKIVITSSWRHLGLDHVRRALQTNGIDSTKIIDKTEDSGRSKGAERGTEVQDWLDQHSEVTNFVIFDDEDDFSKMMGHLVQTNSYVGITQADVKKAIEILNK